jgi:Double zinc ribbon
MQCPECGHKNAAEMKFCGECGNRLTVLCRECGARNAPAQKFCGECGARLGRKGGECRISAEKRNEELFGTFWRKRIDPELTVVGLTAPGVAVFRAVVDEQYEARCRETIDEVVEQALRLAVDPVQILEDQEQ